MASFIKSWTMDLIRGSMVAWDFFGYLTLFILKRKMRCFIVSPRTYKTLDDFEFFGARLVVSCYSFKNKTHNMWFLASRAFAL